MAWFKVDDAFLMSSKVLSIPRSIRPEALGIWTMAGVWAAHEMKDGLVPAHVLEDFGCRDEVRDALLDAGLWIQAENNAVYMNNWAKYQPLKQELEERREAVAEVRSEVGRRGGKASGEARRSKSEANAKQNEAKRTPEPEPEPEPITKLNNVSHVLNTPENDFDNVSSVRRSILNGFGVTNFMQLHTEMVKQTGRDISEEWAFQRIISILSNATQDPDKPQAYLLASIRNSWAELQKEFDETVVA
jgi:hypothetical protein